MYMWIKIHYKNIHHTLFLLLYMDMQNLSAMMTDVTLESLPKIPAEKMLLLQQQLFQGYIVVDKLHMKGHIDPWCKANCDAKSFTDLDNVRWRVN